ncbi:hypothetical protein BT69DRAFT_310133 [Atractiella rhizophila]|nr:hypothetical protein BT69DRAFT_310133 [Atractiella rhizophila]
MDISQSSQGRESRQSTSESIFPPRFTHQGTVQLNNKLYVPFLGVNPACFVLDLARERGIVASHTDFCGEWQRVGVTIPNPLEWKAMTGPIAGVILHGKSYIYLFGPTTFELERSTGSSSSPHVPTASPGTYVPDGPNASPSSLRQETQSSNTSIPAPSVEPAVEPRMQSYFEGFLSTKGSRSAGGTGYTPHISFPESAGVRSSGSTSTASTGTKVVESETNWLLRLDLETFHVEDLTPKNTKSDPLWPMLLKYHSVDCIQNRWLVIFGGVADNGDGENSAHIYDLENGKFIKPNFLGIPPRIRYSHATAVIRNRLYVFGGARNDSPVHVYDDLLSLDVNDGSCTWCAYGSPVSYHYRERSRRKGQMLAGMGDVEMTVEDGTGEIKTTGTQPRERVGACMVPVNERRLLIIGGRTIDDARDPFDSSVTWDEIFSFNINCVDCFDTKLNHFSRVTFPKPFSEAFLRDFACSMAFPLVGGGENRSIGSTQGWGIIVAGFRFLSEDFNNKVSSSGSATCS